MPGVRKAIVSFEKKEALVKYDSSKATLEQMLAALKKSDYSGRLKEEAKKK